MSNPTALSSTSLVLTDSTDNVRGQGKRLWASTNRDARDREKGAPSGSSTSFESGTLGAKFMHDTFLKVPVGPLARFICSFFLEVCFISANTHFAHRDSLLVDRRKTLWVVASENLYMVVVGGSCSLLAAPGVHAVVGAASISGSWSRLPPRRSRVEVSNARACGA